MHRVIGPGRAAVVAVAAGLVAVGDRGPVLCPFRRCTGGYCPGCGLTRAAGRLARGDVAGAWHHHPFLVVAAVEAVVLAGAWAAWRWRRSRRPAPPGRRPNVGSGSLALANLALLVAIWVARLALGSIPVPFA